MKKIIVIAFLFFFAPFFLATKAFAADLTVTCSDSSCETSPLSSPPLFEENNWAPGETVTKTISVINQNSGDDCNLYLALKNKKQTPADFASRIFTVIKQGIDNIFGARNGLDYASSDKTLQDLYNSGIIFLKTIPAGQTMDFGWTVTFDSATGNYYQAAKTTFDFDLNFSCGVPPAPTSTPTPTSTTGDGGGSVSGTSSSATVCNDTKPGLPANFAASVGPGAGQVSLSWTPPSLPYTYFLVAYSDSPDWPPKWGNPNVGNGNSYVVSSLGTGTYYFWLRAGNNCMPGDFVGPVSVNAFGTGGVAAGFLPGVLGVTTENLTPTPPNEGTLGGGIATGTGEVAGIATPVCPFWWIVLIGQTVILGIFYALNRRRKEWIKRWWLVTAVTVLLAYYIDHYAHTHWYVPSSMCRWEIWLGILLATLETIFFKRFRKLSK